jgi:hypothetical protein
MTRVRVRLPTHRDPPCIIVYASPTSRKKPTNCRIHVKVAPTMAEQFVDHCELAHPVVTDGNGRLFLALTKISSLE